MSATRHANDANDANETTRSPSKRPHPSDARDNQAAKRQRTNHHSLRYKQQWHTDPTLAPQDELFFESQLLRSIVIALSAVGFDSVKPTALEAFRAEVEEYIFHFLDLVRHSMLSSRRSQPIPQDFIFALAHEGITSSSLEPHLDIPIPPSITQPTIPPPPPEEPAPPNLEQLLGPDLSGAAENARRHYIPAHLPNLPSRHTWQATPVYPARETDPRKIRERATEEGIMAEQALRKLMAANKSGMKGKGFTRDRQGSRRQQDEQMWKETLEAVMLEDEAERRRHAENREWGADGAVEERGVEGLKIDEGMLVNYERKYWRKGAQSSR